jgi:serpin B
MVVAACSKDDGPEIVGKLPVNETNLQNLVEVKSNYAEKLTQDNDFALDLLRTTAKFNDKPNLLISPLSVAMALNMTMNGAVGETLDEMLTALRVAGYTPEQVNAYSKKLLQALASVDPNVKLSIANSIWYRQELPVLAPFIETNVDSYSAAVEKADFKAPVMVDRINKWVFDNTGGKIEKVLDDIPEDAVMYLINAIYFKCAWEYAFDKSKTTDKPFLNSNGSSSPVPTMALEAELKYGEDDNAAYLELPYANKTFSMVIALPHTDKTVADVVENLDAERWNAAMTNMYEHKVNLNLPRFTFKGDYLLNEGILPEMGMQKAFDKYQADFSNMAVLNPDTRLYISRVIHKTFIEVAEEGTEAAAVTVVEMYATSTVSGPLTFNVDRPFVFAIKENTTGTILFAGSVGEIK